MGDKDALNNSLQVPAGLLVLIAAVLALTHDCQIRTLSLPTAWQLIAGVVAGVLIGIVTAVMGVAGSELLIPTIVLLFGLDIRLAGGLVLANSLPTMLVAFARYSQDRCFVVLRQNWRFLLSTGVFHPRDRGGWAHAQHCLRRYIDPTPRRPPAPVINQGVAAQVISEFHTHCVEHHTSHEHHESIDLIGLN